MRYYRAQFDADQPKWHISAPRDVVPVNIWKFKVHISPTPPSFTIFADGPRVDFNEACCAIIVASPTLADVLYENAPHDVQLVPAVIEGDEGPWYVVNVVTCRDCIDHERSTITYFPKNHERYPGEPRAVYRLVLNLEKIGDHDIFRPKGWEIALIVSEKVKLAMEEIGATGVEFEPIDVVMNHDSPP